MDRRSVEMALSSRAKHAMAVMRQTGAVVHLLVCFSQRESFAGPVSVPATRLKRATGLLQAVRATIGMRSPVRYAERLLGHVTSRRYAMGSSERAPPTQWHPLAPFAGRPPGHVTLARCATEVRPAPSTDTCRLDAYVERRPIPVTSPSAVAARTHCVRLMLDDRIEILTVCVINGTSASMFGIPRNQIRTATDTATHAILVGVVEHWVVRS